jgi:hypothetical protein
MDPRDRFFRAFYNHVMETHVGDSDPDEVLIEILAEEFIAKDAVGYFNMGISIKSLVTYFATQNKKQ